MFARSLLSLEVNSSESEAVAVRDCYRERLHTLAAPPSRAFGFHLSGTKKEARGREQKFQEQREQESDRSFAGSASGPFFISISNKRPQHNLWMRRALFLLFCYGCSDSVSQIAQSPSFLSGRELWGHRSSRDVRSRVLAER